MRVFPYASAGTFVSRVFDGGGATDWGVMSWTADAPIGTTLAMSVRAGETNPPENPWAPMAAPGATGQTGRYMQYKADLGTSNAERTPLLRSVTIGSNPGVDT